MTVLIEKKDSIFTVIINRPEAKNAVDGPTAAALANAFREFEKDDAFLVAVLCGIGNTFCAGADLKAFASLDKSLFNRLEPEGDGPMGPSRMMLKKPVIAAISGYAVAGGLELALWCDIRVMEETAVFGVFCRRFGVPLIDGGTVRLPRLIGMSNAMDMILTGRPVEAVEAKRMGLANRIVPHGESREAAEELAVQIAKFPQMCMRSDRMSAYEQWGKSFDDAMTNEFRHGMETVKKGEAFQGAEKFTKGVGKHGKFQ
ncbi:MAG: crotonase/enoyl-CoA hydratase family protein [Proteobacteria bacterium]|nr:crotonase/enoyl-CoA hydratase family protein [Pseudomonadota bacterium]MBU1711473.1 crotonase/enoyl-CoA hydratase family protein [Pseudomonadota bacterium]